MSNVRQSSGPQQPLFRIAPQAAATMTRVACLFLLSLFSAAFGALGADSGVSGTELPWQKGELKGSFRGDERSHDDELLYYPGSGAANYSFALEASVEAKADLALQVAVTGDGTVRFRLGGKYWQADLSSWKSPPAHVEPPKGFATEQWRSSEPAYLLVGHYYLFRGDDDYVLLQILDFDGGEPKLAVYTWSTTVSVRFRFIREPTLEDLNRVLSIGKPNEGTQTERGSDERPAEPGGKGESPPVGPTPTSADLDVEYQSFQEQSMAFLDKPYERDTSLRDCREFLSTAQGLIEHIDKRLDALDKQAQRISDAVSGLQKDLDSETNAQLKDRIETALNAAITRRRIQESERRTWDARREAVKATQETLQRYRGILERLEEIGD